MSNQSVPLPFIRCLNAQQSLSCFAPQPCLVSRQSPPGLSHLSTQKTAAGGSLSAATGSKHNRICSLPKVLCLKSNPRWLVRCFGPANQPEIYCSAPVPEPLPGGVPGGGAGVPFGGAGAGGGCRCRNCIPGPCPPGPGPPGPCMPGPWPSRLQSRRCSPRIPPSSRKLCTCFHWSGVSLSRMASRNRAFALSRSPRA
jgi:hypothetical protein